MSISRPSDSELPALRVEPDDLEVVVVDDDEKLLSGIARHLENEGYRVRPFASPRLALESIRNAPPALVLTDVEMPGMSGLALTDEVAGIDPDIRVVIMTGQGDEEVAQAALRADVDDYLTKPFTLHDVNRAMRRSLTIRQQALYTRAIRGWLTEEVERQTSAIRDVSLGAIKALVAALEARNPHFKGHSQSVAACAAAVARRLGLDEEEVEGIHTAGLLHDVGMIGVPDSVVDKPDDLTAEEHRLVREHCKTGAEILAPLAHLGSVARYVLEHHERLDGSGYPHRKEGNEISLGGQIVGLAETWTALMESRPYRSRTSPRRAMQILEDGAGTLYRPDLVQALAEVQVGSQGRKA